MTAGSYDRNGTYNSGGFLVGYRETKTWSGSDRPKQPKRIAAKYRVVYRNGASYKFREGLRGSPPPKRALDVENPYSMTGSAQRIERVSIIRKDGSSFPNTTGLVIGGWGPIPLLTANDQLNLLGKLREKLKGSDFNASVFLGESHQTLRMIGDTAIKVAKALHHLRKGDLAGTARSLFEGTSRKPLKPYSQMKPFKPTAERMSSHWLELQYGWLPLLSDVEGGAQAVAHQLSVPLQKTYRMSIRKEQSQDLGNKTSWRPITAMAMRSHRRSLKVIVSEHPSFIASLGLTRPELVAWELLPFSFVADWFIPIGDYLEARAITSLIVAKYVTSDLQSAFNAPPVGPGITYNQAFTRSGAFRRTVDSSANIPLPRFKPLSEAASWQHVANAVALVTQFATGGKVRK